MKTNKKKPVSTYVKIFQEKLKKEEDLKDKSNISPHMKEEHHEVKDDKNIVSQNKNNNNNNTDLQTKKGINFDEISDWGAPEISKVHNENNKSENQNIQINDNNYNIGNDKIENNNMINIDDTYGRNNFGNQVENNNKNNIEDEFMSDIRNNEMDNQILIQDNNYNNNNYQNIKEDFKPSNQYVNNNYIQYQNNYNNINNENMNVENNLENLSLNASNLTKNMNNDNNNYDKFDLSMNTNNEMNQNEIGKKLGNEFKVNISQIKKESDNYENNIKQNSLEDDINTKAQEDIMKQAEKENDILMKQFDDLEKEAGISNNKNNKNNYNKNNQTGKFGVQNDNKINDKKIKLKTKEIKQNIKLPSNQGNVVNMGQIDNLNPQIKMINVNQNEISNNQNYNFNSGTFNPNKQNYTQNIPQQMNNNTIINGIPQYINNNVINNNIPQQMNNNIINNNIPQQMNNNIINNNQIYPNNNVIYPQMQFPNQNQFNQIPSYPYQSPYIQGQIPYNLNQQIPQYNMQNINYNTTNNNVIYQMPEGQIIDNTNSKVKRHINYKPKSLKEYKEKYINDKDINKQRGGLGPNIGTKEWDEREKVKNKVKEYSQKIKGINEEHNIKNNMKYKKDDIIKNQLYDSFNENADIEEEKKLTDEEITVNQNLENETNNDNNNKIEVKDIKNESRMNFLRKLAQKNEEKRNQNNKKKKKEEEESEKKLGKVYTTLKPTSKQKNRQNQQYQTPFDIKKIKDNEINEREKKKNKKINYEDDITKQFMQNIPNEYNGLVKDNKGNLVINPTGEIEHLLQTNKVFNAKVNQIKDYINHMK